MSHVTSVLPDAVPPPSLSVTYRRADGGPVGDDYAWVTDLAFLDAEDAPVELVEERWERRGARRFWHLPQQLYACQAPECDEDAATWQYDPNGAWLRVCAKHTDADRQHSAGGYTVVPEDPAPPLDVSFGELHEANVSRCRRWHPGFPDDGKWERGHWLVALAGEVGEAANAAKKLHRKDVGLPGRLDGTYKDLTRRLGDELADVITYADLFAAFMGWPLPVHHDGPVAPRACAPGTSPAAICLDMVRKVADLTYLGRTAEEQLASLQGLVLDAQELAGAFGIPLPWAVARKFNRVSARQGFPERLGGVGA